MKKFILKISILFVIVLFCDIIFGKSMDYVVNHIETGGQGRDNYICNLTQDDILIFGSSRAVHHYNAQMLEDSLGLTCYNCGADGNGIVLSYGRLTMIKERCSPKIIIEDVTTAFDLFKNDNHQYLGWLKSRYDRDGIHQIFEKIDSTEKYKMYCQMYRYNSQFLQNIFVFFTSIAADGGVKGYRPIKETFDPMKVKGNNDEVKAYEFDETKMDFAKRFIEKSKGSKVYFVVSPLWYGQDTAKVLPMKKLCEFYGVKFIDFSNNSKYVRNNDYFRDGSHLNSRGADEFTRDLICLIKQDMN